MNFIHGSKLMPCTIKQQDLNGQKLQRAITTFHLISRKFSQVISSTVPISISDIKALAQILFEIPC